MHCVAMYIMPPTGGTSLRVWIASLTLAKTRGRALLSKESSACAGLGCFGTLCRAMTDCFADGKIHKKQ